MPRPYDPRPHKRKHDDDNDDDAAAGRNKKFSARKKFPVKEKDPDFVSVNELKKRIRAVKRLLAKPDLPADVRVTQERALKGYEHELETETQNRERDGQDAERKKQSRERNKMIKKYHFIRFLERKTATKEIARLERLQKALTENTELDAATRDKKLASVAKKLHVANVNLNYTIYFPFMEKYIALYADGKKSKKPADGAEETEPIEADDAATVAEKNAMWKTVEQCMKDGTLEALQKRNMDQDNTAETSESAALKSEKITDKSKKTSRDTSTEKKPSAKAKTDDCTKQKKSNAKQDDYEMPDAGEESDGGFFEM
ncbi:Efg1 domain-containing protein [Aspergillus saccharolyticus JOP 1030-1]|uniref:rRNA-processing protein EFG1 n=1 Tax=Aspergillus saccharolyticus JOP 1030-1 TaxID=1450539 RepID=A0A318Z1P3_9EURO|nr:hypothetical protein BP01DRAFT_328782 [Aspergillus saccharolyticus JOP 1030-1]PYH40946.1 hypothetical protein BP01DRAFT_328782 [Aspergillus saccharolyticus JOP 1030-1]